MITTTETNTAATRNPNYRDNLSLQGNAYSQESFCWKGTLAGVVVALLTFSTLLALGLAFGGANLEGVITGPDTSKGLGIGTGIWVVISTAIALFAGGFTAVNATASESPRFGKIQGLVVSGIILLLLVSKLGSGISAVSVGAGHVAGFAGELGGKAAQDPGVMQFVEDAIGSSNLKAPLDVVARGVGTRLLRNDTESATAYLAMQTGMTKAEAQTRIDTIKQKTAQTLEDTGVAAARTMKYAGWILFSMMVLGALASIGGASLAQRKKFASPRLNATPSGKSLVN